MRGKLLWLGGGLVVGLLVGIGVCGVVQLSDSSLDGVRELIDVVGEHQYGQVREWQFVEGAKKGVVGALGDRYGRYMPAKLMREVMDENNGKQAGLGIVYEELVGGLGVVAVLPESPAEVEGVLPGDVVMGVDGVRGGNDQLMGELDGLEVGDRVELELLRGDEVFQVLLERRSFDLRNVDVSQIEPGVLYIKVYWLGANFKPEFEEKMGRVDMGDIWGVVLDMRDVTGGRSQMDIYLADQFLKQATILREEYSSGDVFVRNAADDGMLQDQLMVVLANGNTASAAEVVVAALVENRRAVGVGSTTFGKGTIQIVYELAGGDGVRLTTGRWLTPSGAWLEGVGLTPELVVEDDLETSVDEVVEAGLSDLEKRR